MNIKYIGMDVHKETISIAVMNGEGKVVMESIIETKANTIVHSSFHVDLIRLKFICQCRSKE